MGRVSDALERDSGERESNDVTSDSKHDITAAEVRREVIPEGSHRAANGANGWNHILGTNEFVEGAKAGEGIITSGHVGAESIGAESIVAASETFYSTPARPFRERIEEFLFGWGLGKINLFPLLALEPASPVAEQYRILREQIRKIFREAGAQVLAVTSAAKGEGKTTVAANLAAAVALDHERPILLIDADLRNPTIHKYFGVPVKPGLTDYLTTSSSKDVRHYVYKTSMAGLQILPAGTPTNRSSELLASAKMSRLMKELPVRFPDHLVVVDTSPVLSTSDSIVVAQLVDRIVVVVRAGTTPRSCVTEAIKSLGANKLMGIILNSAELGSDSRYYNSYYPQHNRS